MTRDPRTHPQPGDELRIDGIIRRVIRRKGDMLLIQSESKRYHMSLDRWQKWCGAEATVVVNQGG